MRTERAQASGNPLGEMERDDDMFDGSKPWNPPPGLWLWQRWPSKHGQRCRHHEADLCYFSQLNTNGCFSHRPAASPLNGGLCRCFWRCFAHTCSPAAHSELTLYMFLLVRADVESFYKQTLWIHLWVYSTIYCKSVLGYNFIYRVYFKISTLPLHFYFFLPISAAYFWVKHLEAWCYRKIIKNRKVWCGLFSNNSKCFIPPFLFCLLKRALFNHL